MQVEAAVFTSARPAPDPEATSAEVQAQLRLGQLLCSRVCHDLIGPASAINAGEELIREDDGSDFGEAHELIAQSARQLAARLAFYRMAFGFGGGTEAVLTLEQARSAIAAFLAGSRVQLDWPANGDAVVNRCVFPCDMMRLLLCLVLIAVESLPRGGKLQLAANASGHGLELSLSLAGRGAAVPAEVISAFASDDLSAATPRTIHAFYLAAIARRLDAVIEVESVEADAVRLHAILPFAFDAAPH